MTQSFHPPVRTLMGPGPSDVNPRILEALSRPTIGHLDPAFVGLMNDVKRLIQFTFQTNSALTMPLSAPGSAGMEACFVNLVSPGDKVIVPKHSRLPQMNSVKIPEDVDEAVIRRQLLDEYQLEIGAGLGPLAGNVWRIGLMGYASNRKNVLFCLGTLEALLNRSGGVAEARAVFSTL